MQNYNDLPTLRAVIAAARAWLRYRFTTRTATRTTRLIAPPAYAPHLEQTTGSQTTRQHHHALYPDGEGNLIDAWGQPCEDYWKAKPPRIVLHNQDVPDKYRARVAAIRAMAHDYQWTEVWHKPQERCLRFRRHRNDLIDVWYTKMTVATIIDHPSGRRKPLYRRNMSMAMLELLYKNPRQHTGAGYYEYGAKKRF